MINTFNKREILSLQMHYRSNEIHLDYSVDYKLIILYEYPVNYEI